MQVDTFTDLFAALFKRWQGDDPRTRTKAQLAREVGIDPSLVTHWTRGNTKPDGAGPVLPKLCEVLGASVEEARQLYTACGVSLGPVLHPVEPGEATAAVGA